MPWMKRSCLVISTIIHLLVQVSIHPAQRRIIQNLVSKIIDDIGALYKASEAVRFPLLLDFFSD